LFFGRSADPGRRAQIRDPNAVALSLPIQIVRWASPKVLTLENGQAQSALIECIVDIFHVNAD